MTSKKATITVVAKADQRIVSLVAKVAKQPDGKDTITGLASSTVFTWSEHFQPTGNKTTTGVAKGTAVIYNKSNSSQTLVATTRLLTAQGILFRLAERAIVPANGQVTVPVYADQPGSTSDIDPTQFTIPGLSPDRQKQVYAQSTEPMRGGVATIGVLSDSDLKAAQQIYAQKAQAAFAKTLPSTVPGKHLIMALSNQNVVSNHQIGEEVSEFVLNGTSTIIAVTYDAEQLTQLLDRTITDKIDPTIEKVVSSDAEPHIALASYDAKTGTAELTVEHNLLVTLDANVETLSPQHFVGKRKDEIE